MNKRNIFFVIPPEVIILDIAGPIQVFENTLLFEDDFEMRFLGINQADSCVSNAGLKFHELEYYQDVEVGKDDILFIPGINVRLLDSPDFILNNEPFFNWLRQQYLNKAMICSVCTGAFLLAEAGLYKGKKCTTHWKYLDKMEKKFPDADVQRNCVFVEDKGIISSAGESTGIDLALFLIERFYGTKRAVEVAQESVVYFRRGGNDDQLSVFLQYRNHINDRIHAAQDFIEQNLDQSFTIDEVADAASMSRRNLTRQFKNTVGITLGEFQEKLRIDKALKLKQEGIKMDVIASEIGLKSTNQVRTLLQRYQA